MTWSATVHSPDPGEHGMIAITQLQCQNCSAVLERQDEFQKAIACKYCGSAYEVTRPTESGQQEQLVARNNLRPIKPDNLGFRKEPGLIEVLKYWKTRNSYILLIMSIIWLGAILNQVAEIWLEGINSSILFLIVFIVVGGIMLYRALSEIFNTSTLTVNKQEVVLKTSPFMWKGDFSHPMNSIKYFEIVPPPGLARVRNYRVCAITDDDMRLTLLEKIHNPGHAIYLLREINQVANS